MKNKRGGIFDFSMFFLILLMVSLVLWGYSQHQDDLAGSLVSPLSILKLSDDLEVFEVKEMGLIEDNLAGVNWGENNFEYGFLVNFLGGFDSEMEEFILDDLFWNGAKVPVNEGFDTGAFFKNALYSVDFDSETLILKRNEVGKKFNLEANDKSKVSFPVEGVFRHDAEYLIKKESNEIIVERLD